MKGAEFGHNRHSYKLIPPQQARFACISREIRLPHPVAEFQQVTFEPVPCILASPLAPHLQLAQRVRRFHHQPLLQFSVDKSFVKKSRESQRTSTTQQDLRDSTFQTERYQQQQQVKGFPKLKSGNSLSQLPF